MDTESVATNAEKNDWVTGWFGQMVFALILVMGVFYILNQRIDILSQSVNEAPPPVMVFNIEKSLKTLMDDGMSTSNALLYTDTMMKVLKARGIIVIDVKSVLALPDGVNVELISQDDLYKVAAKFNVAPSTADRREVESALKSAQADVNELLGQIK
ncbi:MAG: hypothetical protein ACI9T7_000010 [Oleiphilaceae bacterium]|jgi:hypothetical protein